MAKSTGNIAGIGTILSNAFYNTNFKSTYKIHDVHEQVAVLKQNLRDYRKKYCDYDWSDVPSLVRNTSNIFDSETYANLIKFQQFEGITVDGIYGQQTRNYLAARVGISPKGFVRIPNSTSYLINYNDTAAGLFKDSKYRLDHSWVTLDTYNTLVDLARAFHAKYGKRLEINDCSLIDGSDTPEHRTHQSGKEADIRIFFDTMPMSKEEQTYFLKLCVEHPAVVKVIFKTNHGLNSQKIKVDQSGKHDDHFHVETVA